MYVDTSITWYTDLFTIVLHGIPCLKKSGIHPVFFQQQMYIHNEKCLRNTAEYFQILLNSALQCRFCLLSGSVTLVKCLPGS